METLLEADQRRDLCAPCLPSRISKALCCANVNNSVLLERGTPGQIRSAAWRRTFKLSGDNRTFTCNDRFESFTV
jgi:hypothetical protein